MAFSLGPYGAALADGSEYDGRYAERVTEEQLMHFHRQRLQVRSKSANRTGAPTHLVLGMYPRPPEGDLPLSSWLIWGLVWLSGQSSKSSKPCSMVGKITSISQVRP